MNRMPSRWITRLFPAILMLIIGALPGIARATVSAAPLEAGVAVVDITPPAGMRMSGYFHERLSTGTRNPLHAKALVFTQDHRGSALVFCDLISIAPDVARRARRAASEITGIPASNIVIAATHSHTGPLYYGAMRVHFHEKALARHGKDPHEPVDYPQILVDRIVQAIEEAHGHREPVVLEAGVGEEKSLSFNRRFHMKDGPVRFNPGQQNPNIVRPAGPIDPDVGVLLIRRAASREPLAVLTVFALHLDTVGGTEYAADYPYYLQEQLKAQLSPTLVSLFGIGTCGDINHIDVSIKGRRSSEEIGTRLAETVLRTLKNLQPVTPPLLAVAGERLELPMQRYNEDEVAEAAKIMEKVDSRDVPFLERVKARSIMDIQHRGGGTLSGEVQAIRLGPETALVTLPGEVFVDLGLAIKEASPFRTTLVIELANDGPGYIPTRKAFAEGSYETVNSRIQPGGGERLVDTAITLLRKLKSDLEGSPLVIPEE